MKKKEIGQCKDCKWYYEKEGVCDLGKCLMSDIDFYIPKTFGCWYWKEKKK